MILPRRHISAIFAHMKPYPLFLQHYKNGRNVFFKKILRSRKLYICVLFFFDNVCFISRKVGDTVNIQKH